MGEWHEGRLLPHIPGPVLSRGSKVLPDAATVTDSFMDVQVIVTVRYERKSHAHGRSARNYYWTADSAEITYANPLESK